MNLTDKHFADLVKFGKSQENKMSVRNIVVEAVGKYGPKVNGEFLGLKRPLKPADFVKGESYDVELEEWKEGRFNIAKIIRQGGTVSEATTETVSTPSRSKTTFVNKSVSSTGRDFEAEARGKVYNNLAASIAQSPYLAGVASDEEFIERIDAIALKLAEKTFEYQKGK